MSKETKAAIMAGVPHTRAKIIANNTVEYFRENGERVIRLHHTDIAWWSPDGRTVTLNSGGWKTVTTKQRLNELVLRSRNIGLYSAKGSWFLNAQQAWEKEGAVPFYDGIQIKDGKLPKPKHSTVDKDRALGDRIIKFVNRLKDMKELPAPSLGDCLFCQRNVGATHVKVQFGRVESGRLVVSDTPPEDHDRDHLMSHVKEGYLHGSLIVAAMRWAGYTDARIGMAYQMWPRDGSRARTMLTNTLRRYLRRKFGLAQS